MLKMTYVLAQNCGYEGWSIQDYATIEELKKAIKGQAIHSTWRIFKEIDIQVIEPEYDCPKCRDGIQMIGTNKAGQPDSETVWHTKCPDCGRTLRTPEELYE